MFEGSLRLALLLSILAENIVIALNPSRHLQLPFGSNHNSPASVTRQIAEQGFQRRDTYGTSTELQSSEKEIASALGKDAGAFFVSGTMAQQAALATHAFGKSRKGNNIQPILVAHPTSHLLIWEDDAVKELLGFEVITTANKHNPMNFEAVKNALDEAKEQAKKLPFDTTPCFGIIIELPHRELGGSTTSLSDLMKICQLADQENAFLHLDGARLLEVAPHYEACESDVLNSLKEKEDETTLVTLAGLFDSAFLSFYKGMGSMTGSMLLGSSQFMENARVWRHRFGGQLYALWPYASHCAVCWREIFGKGDDKEAVFASRYRRMCEIVELISSEGKGVCGFVPIKPQASMVHCRLKATSLEALNLARDRAASTTGISVFERTRAQTPVEGEEGKYWFTFEWSTGTVNSQISDADVLRAWKALVDELKR